jgi:hypothetical protein
MWMTRQPFIVVEHDVVVTEEALVGFADCPHLWCTWAVERHDKVGAPLTASLGCVRFHRHLICAEPGLPKAADEYDGGLPPRDWRNRDDAYRWALTARGYQPHVHHPALRHLR